MHKSLTNLSVTLESLAKAIVAGKPDKTTFLAAYGWNCPPLTSAQVAEFASKISLSINASKIDDLSSEDIESLSQCQTNVAAFQSSTLPYFFNGNASGAFPSYFALIDQLNLTLQPILGWIKVNDSSTMPASVARRLERLNAAIEGHSIVEMDIAEKISLIQNAADAAEELPLTLKQLNEAQKKVENSASQSSEYIGKIDSLLNSAKISVDYIEDKAKESDTLVRQVSDAYRAATSEGLAKAFDARAIALEKTMNFWVAGLVLALCAGGIVGYFRFDKLTTALSTTQSNSVNVWIELVLTVASLGLPLWFAWLSTKQIGQRFRLSEDYAFKASVAKAYEGYRREAARFEPAIEERLFKAALTRLEEEPLRYVETTTHGSPIQESGVIETIQDAFKDAKELVSKRTAKILAPSNSDTT